MGARDDGRFAGVFLAVEGDDTLNVDAQTSAYGRRRSASAVHHRHLAITNSRARPRRRHPGEPR
jgi:hypothetical protein